MTSWSTPALLFVGIAAGPHGLDLLSASVLLVLDPGIAMALAMLGVFVGLSFDVSQRQIPRLVAASGLRTVTTVIVVGAAALAIGNYWLSPGSLLWQMAIMFGVCAAVSNADTDVNADDVLMIVAGGVVLGAIRASAAGPALTLGIAFAAIVVAVAMAGWMLVGQTSSEGEQHVFVVGTLLLLGGAATYVSQSASFAGLLAGVTWNVARGLPRTRILRDLHYFQHPLVVLGLVSAGATATISIDAMALAVLFVAMRALSRPIGPRIARWQSRVSYAVDLTPSRISAGLVGIALAFDLVRIAGRPEWGMMLLSAVVIGSIVSEALALLMPAHGSPA